MNEINLNHVCGIKKNNLALFKVSIVDETDYNNNHHGAEISVIWLVKRSAIKLLILIRY